MSKGESENAMERFEDLLGRIVSVTKEDVKKAEEAAEELVDEALGPPPVGGPAIAEDED